MTLQVPFETFPAVVARVLKVKEAFVTRHSGGALVTAADPQRGALVACIVALPVEEAREKLVAEGLEVFEGSWTGADTGDLACEMAEAFVAAISFQSSEGKPGIWVDAFPSLPTQIQVLRGMYDELRDTGELSDVSFEEFVRLANPTVVILSPSDLRSFLTQKTPERPVEA